MLSGCFLCPCVYSPTGAQEAFWVCMLIEDLALTGSGWLLRCGAAVLALGLGACAHTLTRPPHPMDPVQQQAMMARCFAQADQNHDGQLSLQEFQKLHLHRMAHAQHADESASPHPLDTAHPHVPAPAQP